MKCSVVLVSRQPLPLAQEAIAALLPQCREHGAGLTVVRAGDFPAAAGATGYSVIRCDERAPVPELRARGLAAAAGTWILMTEDNCVARPDWLTQLIAGTNDGVDVIGGVIGNRQTARRIDAAAAFTEYGTYGAARPVSDAIPAVACANAGYHRRVVDLVVRGAASGQWEDEIHRRLRLDGRRFQLIPDAIVEQNVQHSVGQFCRDRFEHGLEYARVRGQRLTNGSRFWRAVTTPLLAPVLTWRAWLSAGRSAPRDFVRAVPFVLLFFSAWSAGEATGYIRGRKAAA